MSELSGTYTGDQHAAGPDTPAVRNLLGQLTSRTSESDDGSALRDLLAHESVHDRLEPGRTAWLERALAACTLGSATLPVPVRDRLEAPSPAPGRCSKSHRSTRARPEVNPLERRTRTAPSSDAEHPVALP
ncbi:hypothetical protein [Kitasatospora sp. NPDC092286]|uniref:hypothetical protein n=1 Tax=Kitasatospora sp. NPDC092286 TaxID=3364087 RepID=UPI0037F3F898